MSTFGTLSVTKFNTYVRNIFNSEELLHNVKIVGEVFGVSYSRGQAYFSLKDEESTLPCVAFSPNFTLKEGEAVIATGSPNFYVKGGRFNFVVSKIESFGQGLLIEKFLKLKQKLQDEGLFDEAHKKTMPKVVKRIGVVTSKDGAVLQDIKNVTWRRNPAVDIVLYSTKVQGNGAESEIAAGIRFFSTYENVDVVIVARGGGSLEDLSAYNTELVAREAYLCEKPIVSAVGHETDFTIIDFVSDLRTPTPSAAAELLTKDTQQMRDNLRKSTSRLSRLAMQTIANENMRLKTDKEMLQKSLDTLLQNQNLAMQKQKTSLSSLLKAFLLEEDYKLKLKTERLNKHNPLDILSLGYAKIEQQGANISKLENLDKKKPFEVYFVDGEIDAVVKERS